MLDRRGGYEYEDLLACGRGEMFGPGNAQLPLPPMLMFDRISEISETGGEFGKGLVRAELDVKPDLWFFGCHSRTIRSCQAVSDLMRCGRWSVFTSAGSVARVAAARWD